VGRAIKYMCSHCGHAIYFEEYVSLVGLYELECRECGRGDPVLALDVERPPNRPILKQIPPLLSDHVSPSSAISAHLPRRY
jgi:hypothetical protein